MSGNRKTDIRTLTQRCGDSGESNASAMQHSFGSVDPLAALNECCVADAIAFRSVTQHAFGSYTVSTEPNEW